MASSPAVIAEFEKRRDAEREKARTKYGEDALIPTGKPGYDILDYAINELVGFIRYASMIEARHRMMLDVMDELPKRTRELLKDSIGLARELEAFAARYSYNTIDLWQKLKKQGLMLGITEKTA